LTRLIDAQVNQRVQSIARSLAHVKMPAGGRICIYAETRADWTQMALACMQHKLTSELSLSVRVMTSVPLMCTCVCGPTICAVVTVYATLGEEAIQHAINETESSTIICSAVGYIF